MQKAQRSVEERPPTPGESRHDLGIVFVHGIGQQRRGDPLRWFVDPVVSWLQRWLTRGSDPLGQRFPLGGAGARVEEGRLQEDAPSHAILKLRTFAREGRVERTWLVTESHWADDVHAPSFTVIALWMMLLGPYLVIDQFWNAVARTRRRRSDTTSIAGWPALAVSGFALALAPVWAVLLEVVILVLLLGTFVPVFGVSRLARRLGVMLSATIGDSYVLTSSPTQFGIMIGTTLRAMRWTAARAKRVVVVAHSQGAAVAHAALQRGLDPPVSLFATVGSGLKRLHVLTSLRLRRGALTLVALPCVAGVLLAAFAGPKTLLSAWAPDKAVPQDSALLALTGVLSIALAFALTVQERGKLKRDALWLPNRAAMTWVDYYASADLVPDGPVVEEDDDAPGQPTSIEVANFASLFRDHTGYMANDDQLLADLIHRLAYLSDPELELVRPPVNENDILDAAWWRRSARVRLRSAGRLLILALAAAALWVRPTLARLGGTVLDPGATTASIGVPSEFAFWRNIPESVWQALVAVLLLALVLLGVGSLIWAAIDRAQVAAFFSDRSPPSDTPAGPRPISGAVVRRARWERLPRRVGFGAVPLVCSVVLLGVSVLVGELEVGITLALASLGVYSLGVGLLAYTEGRRQRRGALARTGLSASILSAVAVVLLLALT